MTRARFFYVLLCVLTAVFAGAIGARAAGSPSAPSVAQGGGADNGWTLPPTAAAEKNPLTVNDAVLASGKKLFGDKCARCHGLHGKGDGPEGDDRTRRTWI